MIKMIYFLISWWNIYPLDLWHYASRPHVVINFFETILSWPVIHLVVRWGISHFFTATRIQPRSGGKRTKNKRTIWAWVDSKCKKGHFLTLHSLCICILSRACISSKLQHATRNANLSLTVFLTAPGLYLTPTALFCCPLSTALCVSLRQLTSLGSFSNSLSGFSRTCLSSPTSGLVRDLKSKPVVWFRAKTDKGVVCLVDHPHSVANLLILLVEKTSVVTNFFMVHNELFQRFTASFLLLWS